MPKCDGKQRNVHWPENEDLVKVKFITPREINIAASLVDDTVNSEVVMDLSIKLKLVEEEEEEKKPSKPFQIWTDDMVESVKNENSNGTLNKENLPVPPTQPSQPQIKKRGLSIRI